METSATLHLPPYSKITTFPDLLGQEPSSEGSALSSGLVLLEPTTRSWTECGWNWAQIDPASIHPRAPRWGYLARLLDGSNVKIYGCIGPNGEFWPCEEPQNEPPATAPFMRVVPEGRGRRGTITADLKDAPPFAYWEATGRHKYKLTKLPERFNGALTSPDAPELELCELIALASACFVTLYETSDGSDENSQEAFSLDVLTKSPLPDALDRLLEASDSANPLARYSARILARSGAKFLRPLAAKYDCTIVRLPTSNLWWIRMPSDLPLEDRRQFLKVESAINRIQLILDNESALASKDEDYIQSFDVYKNTVGLLNLIETHKLSTTSDENPLRTVQGFSAPKGSEWDARTRISQSCERFPFFTRLEYRCDIDIKLGVATFEYAVPDPDLMPTPSESGMGTTKQDLANLSGIYLATFLASTAFESNVCIMNCVVNGFAGSLGGDCIMSFSFTRSTFESHVLATLESCHSSTKPKEVAADLGQAARFLGGHQAVESFRVEGLTSRRCDPSEDQRELPDRLKDLLRADRVCELEVNRDFYPEATQQVDQIVEEEKDSPVVAIMRLETLAAEVLETYEKDYGAQEGLVPLYCDGYYARMTIHNAPPGGTLLTGIDALKDPLALSPEHAADPHKLRYFRVPDAYFAAKYSLSNRYRDLDDYPSALAILDQLIAIAPSSSRPRLQRAVVLGDMQDWQATIEAIIDTLKVAPDLALFPYCFYRMAYAYWHLGQHDLAAACYTLAQRDPDISDQAQHELFAMQAETHIELPDVAEASRRLQAQGIPLVPVASASETLAQSTISLVECDVPLMAWTGTFILGDRMYNDALAGVGRSLLDGTPSAYA